MKRVSKHAKSRINERSSSSVNTSKNLIGILPLKNGIELNAYVKLRCVTPIINYLNHKKQNGSRRFFLYQGYVFIYSASLKNLITTYPLPERFKPEFDSFKEFKKTKKEFYQKYPDEKNTGLKKYSLIVNYNKRQLPIYCFTSEEKAREFLPILLKGYIWTKREIKDVIAYLEENKGIKIRKAKKGEITNERKNY